MITLGENKIRVMILIGSNKCKVRNPIRAEALLRLCTRHSDLVAAQRR